ncbi:mono and diacylglycerol lipase [Achaetomium macrosporum]|uniref:Mono and diacylglycerol lipase n=1 Tax=Achaetomium macrosporum TaxID=79813 RepID=A0AAN7H720_9PEZI|nr:mono and diacylglycerol lipase [Achaetomium macrosporum]
MGFFTKSKKVNKNSPATRTKEQHRSAPGPPTQISQGQHPGISPRPQPPPFQTAGLLPPPSGWHGGVQPPTAYQTAYQQPGAYPPIILNQHHYYLGAQPPVQTPARLHPTNTPGSTLDLGSVVDLAKEVWQGSGIPRLVGDALPVRQGCGDQLVNQGNALVHEISTRLDGVLTMIDQGGYDGKEEDIYAWQPTEAPTHSPPPGVHRGERGLYRTGRKSHGKDRPKGHPTAASEGVSGSIFARVDHYANSRLPMNLPPLRLYIPTYPLLCLAAQYSERVYEPPTGRAERDAHVRADWRTGTKAMVIKSVPMDHMNTIVFAIRGTATFMDWAVNLNMAPTSPVGFLDDPGNLCHAGFLSVARNMVAPVARRLRQLLEEDPGRASYSLLITGHSAGGAVAALLYSHMITTSKAAESELNTVVGCFKRIHCITFGTPPVSMLPLMKPNDYAQHPQLKRSLFLSFVNEGDPVTRADKAYVKSLLQLYATPVPRVAEPRESELSRVDNDNNSRKKQRRSDKPSSKSTKKPPTATSGVTSSSLKTKPAAGPIWNVPPCTLSCAGRIVVLRSGDAKARPRGKKKTTIEERLHEGVVAQIATDEQLRGVIWGDPVAHMMRLYAGRIEVLAVGAVTGQGY